MSVVCWGLGASILHAIAPLPAYSASIVMIIITAPLGMKAVAGETAIAAALAVAHRAVLQGSAVRGRAATAIHAISGIAAALTAQYSLHNNLQTQQGIAAIMLAIAQITAIFCENQCCYWTKRHKHKTESFSSLLDQHFTEYEDLEENEPLIQQEDAWKNAFSYGLVALAGSLHAASFVPFIYHIDSLQNDRSINLFQKISLFAAPFSLIILILSVTVHLIYKFVYKADFSIDCKPTATVKEWIQWIISGIIWASIFLSTFVSLSTLGFLKGYLLSQMSIFFNGIWAICVTRSLNGTKTILLFSCSLLLAIGSAALLICQPLI